MDLSSAAYCRHGADRDHDSPDRTLRRGYSFCALGIGDGGEYESDDRPQCQRLENRKARFERKVIARPCKRRPRELTGNRYACLLYTSDAADE